MLLERAKWIQTFSIEYDRKSFNTIFVKKKISYDDVKLGVDVFKAAFSVYQRKRGHAAVDELLQSVYDRRLLCGRLDVIQSSDL